MARSDRRSTGCAPRSSRSCSWRSCASSGRRVSRSTHRWTSAASSGSTAPQRSRRCAANSHAWPAAAARRSSATSSPSGASRPSAPRSASSTSTAMSASTTASATSRRRTSPACASPFPRPPTTGPTTPGASRSSSSPPTRTPAWSRCPKLLKEVRALVGERRVTGLRPRRLEPEALRRSPRSGVRLPHLPQGHFRHLPRRCFGTHVAVLEGKSVTYQLADKDIRLLGGKLRLRQVTRLTDQGRHQTPIVTSRRDLPAVEVAFRMFERWRQENFFKYLREEFALDALIDHGVVPDDATREVPNPKWAEVDAKLRAARDRVGAITRRSGGDATLRELGVATTRRALLDRHTRRELGAAVAESMKLERRRAAIPRRIPVGERTNSEVIKLSTERKHLSNVLKMVAYRPRAISSARRAALPRAPKTRAAPSCSPRSHRPPPSPSQRTSASSAWSSRP